MTVILINRLASKSAYHELNDLAAKEINFVGEPFPPIGSCWFHYENSD